MYPNILDRQPGINRVPKQGNKSASSGQVRIIAGQWRGRRLAFPDVKGLRPSGDRVRETLFNWLQLDLPEARCLDLFAGSGALGYEAASRHAASVVMIEQNREAYSSLQHNRDNLAATNVELIHQDALLWLATKRSAHQPFDIAFLDPPFDSGLLDEAIQRLETGGWLASGALIYTECAIGQSANNLRDKQWQLHRQRTFGEVDSRLYRRP
jgi:16S rRNA (guanine966-N2)-methyltransferase